MTGEIFVPVEASSVCLYGTSHPFFQIPRMVIG